jgi:hypothetical protein
MPTELIRKQFLLTDEENKVIEERAKVQGLSVSNLTRTLYGLEPLKKGFPPKEKKETAKNNKLEAQKPNKP